MGSLQLPVRRPSRLKQGCFKSVTANLTLADKAGDSLSASDRVSEANTGGKGGVPYRLFHSKPLPHNPVVLLTRAKKELDCCLSCGKYSSVGKKISNPNFHTAHCENAG